MLNITQVILLLHIFLSNFDSCLGLTIDGFGDFSSMESFECNGKV